ncbi:MAG: DUF6079 family protein [Acidimicrobiales bacterium]
MTTYRDLIQFEPIVDIKVLTEANAIDNAREDVRTFVVSAPMCDSLSKLLVPNLRFDMPGEHKGVFVVAASALPSRWLQPSLHSSRDRDAPVVAVHEIDRDTDVRPGPADVDRSFPCVTCRSSQCQPL